MGKGQGKGGSKGERMFYYNCGGCLLACGCLLILILVPMSFVKLQYYEHGLKMQRSTSTVKRNKVYGPGSHQVGPDYEFKKFQTSLISFDESLSVWTKSGGDAAGVSIYVDVSFQYLLRPDNLAELYDMVALQYESNIKSVAIDALKSTAVLFGADDYLTKRTQIQSSMALNVTHAIDKFYADVVNLQLRRVQFEDDYYETKKTAAVQLETNYKEEYVQSASLVRTQTDVMAELIENSAVEVAETAVATAELLIATSEYSALETVETARNDGLKALYEALDVETESQKASLDYLLMLTDKSTDGLSHIMAYVDFDAANAFR